MQDKILTLLAALICLAGAPAFAQQPRGQAMQDCARNAQTCRQDRSQAQRPSQPQQQAQPQASSRQTPGAGQAARPAQQVSRATPPRVGQSARSGRGFAQAANSRFPRAARGQEYRTVNDHLVLVDSNTLQILAIVGLLDSLLN